MYDGSLQHVSLPYKFTGKERDSESNLDNFGARYYSSSLGRFMSADWYAIPAPVPYANLTNPQTLNLYAILHDNPETYADLDGHDVLLDCTDCPQEGKGVYQSVAADQKVQEKAQNQQANPTFTNVDKAAASSARADQALQKKNGGEYGSLVYSADGKTFTYTTPVTQGQKTTVDPFNTTGVPQPKTADLGKAPIPPGTQLYAETHSHPEVSGFSGEDVQRAHDLTIHAFGHPDFKGEYVGLPNGNVIKYDPATGKQYTFAPGQP